MKRALIIGTGTVMGVAAVLALNPEGGAAASGNLPTLPPSSTSDVTPAGSTTTAGGTSINSNGGSTSNEATSPNSGSTSGLGTAATSSKSGLTKTVTGSAVDVGYGIVQVKAVIKSGKLVDVKALSLPNGDGQSLRIARQAFPLLVKQAIVAQSANVAGIGGASYTSYGFQKSLSSALSKAGFKR
jgi:uncharacterized protein with FMN-binding domain